MSDDDLSKRPRREIQPELDRMRADHERTMRLIAQMPELTEEQRQAIAEANSEKGWRRAMEEVLAEATNHQRKPEIVKPLLAPINQKAGTPEVREQSKRRHDERGLQPPRSTDTLPWWIWLFPIAVVLIATARLPYDYYTFTRLVVCTSAAFIVFLAWVEKSPSPAWSILFGLIAVLFNPVLPIHLTRETWFYYDIGTAAAFAAHLFVVRLRWLKPN